MVTHRGILFIGECLRKNPNKYLTLKQLKDLLVDNSNSFHDRTIRKYMQILTKNGYIKSVVINEIPMFEILRSVKNDETQYQMRICESNE